ncbi:hypothetical protein PoB_003328700 [Plakobranchus ocellatus]|uniref:Uncharacterized protein n=1 Tax=Plakobranchus ocellatus TaxID=259542 RepID=A0AAV4AID4_9GAST|nr:hypothetical protein PoB_003328700 [Plakobranchus ocellatus]
MLFTLYRLLEPKEPPLPRDVNLWCRVTGVSNNDNLCHNTGVSPLTATLSYPQYDNESQCPPNRFKAQNKQVYKKMTRGPNRANGCCYVPPQSEAETPPEVNSSSKEKLD